MIKNTIISFFCLLLLFGTGQAQSPKDIRQLLHAAERGDSSAQFTLGDAYHYGAGVTQDKAEAVKWYRRAADQGNAQAQYSLGVAYEIGEGVLQDKDQATEWYRLSAVQGKTDAKSSFFRLKAEHAMHELDREWYVPGVE
jgi:TPR repeat protein